jgi:prophage tail gpP-like protein
MSEVLVKVRGATFLGWKDILITRSLESLCASFSLSYIDAWQFADGQGGYSKWYLKPGDPCEIFIDSDLLITGYIDEVNSSYDGDSRTFSVAGRDKTSDLVDCAASIKAGRTYSNLTVAQCARLLLSPFNISLVEQASSGKPIPRISVDNGQTVFDVLENASKQRGLLLTTNEKGEFVITTPGLKKASVAIIEGETNILSAAMSLDHKKRFSVLVALGQGNLTEGQTTELTFQAKASATDPVIDRYRPRVITAERAVTQNELTLRAQWEAKYNAAKSASVQMSLNGWRQGTDKNAPLWDTNMRVQVDAPELSIRGEMLIETVRYRLNEQGEVCELTLSRPDAWVPNPIVKDETQQFLKDPPT